MPREELRMFWASMVNRQLKNNQKNKWLWWERVRMDCDGKEQVIVMGEEQVIVMGKSKNFPDGDH